MATKLDQDLESMVQWVMNADKKEEAKAHTKALLWSLSRKSPHITVKEELLHQQVCDIILGKMAEDQNCQDSGEHLL
jgi:hypothetical protein